MHVYQLWRSTWVDEVVAAGGRLVETGADHDEEIRLSNTCLERVRLLHPQFADVGRGIVVEQVLPAKRRGNRQLVRLGIGNRVGAGLFVPAAAADNHERPGSLCQFVLDPQCADRIRTWLGGFGPVWVTRRALVGKDVLR